LTHTPVTLSLSLHDALPISGRAPARIRPLLTVRTVPARVNDYVACVNAGIAKSVSRPAALHRDSDRHRVFGRAGHGADGAISRLDRKSTRLNSSHDQISYAV